MVSSFSTLRIGQIEPFLATPFGQLPILEVDGKPIPQSIAIARFLAKRFGKFLFVDKLFRFLWLNCYFIFISGFAGADDLEEAQIDALVDLLNDYMMEQKNFFGITVGRVPGDKVKLNRKLRTLYRNRVSSLASLSYH